MPYWNKCSCKAEVRWHDDKLSEVRFYYCVKGDVTVPIPRSLFANNDYFAQQAVNTAMREACQKCPLRGPLEQADIELRRAEPCRC